MGQVLCGFRILERLQALDRDFIAAFDDLRRGARLGSRRGHELVRRAGRPHHCRSPLPGSAMRRSATVQPRPGGGNFRRRA
ncbi:MAG: hypothetical protein U0703_13400 [Anaerolineae bacterium]